MIDIQTLSKSFGKTSWLSKFSQAKPTKTVLNDISLHWPDNAIVGLLGQNGAGKTTLLRILASLIAPSSGRALVAGFDCKTQSHEVRTRLGLVTAGMGLYERLTARENLQLFGRLNGLTDQQIEQRIEQLAAQLRMGDFLDHQAGGFSTGMKQKVVVARAVLHEPSILILDEASNGLDVLSRRALLDFALTYKQPGKLVIYSTHIMSEVAELCDRVSMIHHGRVLADDSIEALLQQHQSQTLEQAFIRIVEAYEAKHGVRS
jgi:sodium transport system ATP-binding protein